MPLLTSTRDANSYQSTIRSNLVPYAKAIGFASLGILLRYAFNPIFGERLPYVMFFPAILLAGLYGGLGPGILCILLCSVAGIFFVDPNLALGIHAKKDALGWGVFLCVAAVIVFLAESQRKAKTRVEAVAQELEAKEGALRTRNRKIEVLNAQLHASLQETHHRVKNNLQVVAAMLEIQMMDHPDALPVSEAQRLLVQIKTLASIHELLHPTVPEVSTNEMVSVKALLERLLSLMDAVTEGYEIVFAIEESSMPIKQATALALTVQELVMNAIKHGKDSVGITFRQDEAMAILEVYDDGPGFPPGFDCQEAANTGLMLVESFVKRDLHGSIDYENRAEGGAFVRVTFAVESVSGSSLNTQSVQKAGVSPWG